MPRACTSFQDALEARGKFRLRLMFTRCLLALPLEAQVALTRRTLAGLQPASSRGPWLGGGSEPAPVGSARLLAKLRHVEWRASASGIGNLHASADRRNAGD